MINEWGITKGRLEKEINRRYESKVFGSIIKNIILRILLIIKIF